MGILTGKADRKNAYAFCKQLLGVKASTQNDFIYGKLGRTNYHTRRKYIVIIYWVKVVHAEDRKYMSNL